MEQPQPAKFSLSERQTSGNGNMENLQSTFIQNVSHELRTPLQIVHGYASLLHEGDLGDLAPEQKEAIATIANRADKLRNIVERIGILLAIEGGAGAQQTVELDDTAADVVDTYQAIAAENELSLRMNVERDLPPVLGDPYHLEQVIDSLVENAIKFTPEGGEIQVDVGANDECVSVTVTDTGIGIEEEELERIFSGFYQVDRSMTRQYGGLGLGLTLVRAVVEEHQGEIEVESQPGHGSRFTVRFPAMAPADTAERAAEGEPILQHVLIVDDEEFVALTLSEALSSLPNCEVTTAASGDEALQLLEKQAVDLLITDYKMPDINGIDLANAVREQYPRTVVIMVTAYGDDLLREQAAESSIQRIMDKPVRLADIRDVTLEALGRLRKRHKDE